MPPAPDVTELLLAFSAGDRAALDRLVPIVYDELRELAHARLRREREGHTLSTTDLVHEAYLRLVDIERVQWQSRAHFLATASRLMRRILVDYERARRAAKRGGGAVRIALEEDVPAAERQSEALFELDQALVRLAVEHPRAAQAVEQRYFGGLSNQEIAAVLDVSLATVERDLRFARAWLARTWEGERGPEGAGADGSR